MQRAHVTESALRGGKTAVSSLFRWPDVVGDPTDSQSGPLAAHRAAALRVTQFGAGADFAQNELEAVLEVLQDVRCSNEAVRMDKVELPDEARRVGSPGAFWTL